MTKRVLVDRRVKHGWNRGYKRHPLHHVYVGMIARCCNPRSGNWERYGARGISVCERWRQSFVAFVEDMGPRPTPDHQLDRINNDGNYEPGNCRWATRIEQQSNRRTCRLITIGGVTQTVALWARQSGLTHSAILRRLNNGDPVSELLRPSRKDPNRRKA